MKNTFKNLILVTFVGIALFFTYEFVSNNAVGIFPNKNMENSVILDYVNMERDLLDTNLLVFNDKLNAAAKKKLDDMFAKGYFEHVSPEGIEAANLVSDASYEFITVGENLIQGLFKDEQEVVKFWMNSPGHRKNIINENYIETGIASGYGEFGDKELFMSVQIFAVPLSICPPPSNQLTQNIEEKEQRLEVLKINMKTEDNILEYNKMVTEHNNILDELIPMIEEYNNKVKEQEECFSTYK